MNRITLNNLEELEQYKKKIKKPETLDEVVKLKKVKESLMDNGISNFKEITNLNNISFGHFILIEKILAVEDLEPDKRIAMISPIILRPLGEAKIDNEDREKELKHKEEVFNENIGNIYGAFNRFMELRKEYLFKTYNGVIYGVLDEDEDDEEEDEGTSVNSGQTAREFHTKKFFWQSLVNSVANDNIFDHERVVELMMYVVMPHLAEKRSLSIVENLEQKASRI